MHEIIPAGSIRGAHRCYLCNPELGDPVSQTGHGGDFGTDTDQCDFCGAQELDQKSPTQKNRPIVDPITRGP
jgi:hypothetical protein